MVTDVNWVDIVSVLPRGDPYRQSQQLIKYGILHNRWLFIPAISNTKSAQRLAESLDAITCRAIKKHSVGSMYFPHGILMLERHAIQFRASYHPDYKADVSVPITIVEATGNLHSRAQCVLQSGMASAKFIFITGHLAEMRPYANYLHEAVLRGSINGMRIVEPRPLGIMTCTHTRWEIVFDYTRLYSSDV